MAITLYRKTVVIYR